MTKSAVRSWSLGLLVATAVGCAVDDRNVSVRNSKGTSTSDGDANADSGGAGSSGTTMHPGNGGRSGRAGGSGPVGDSGSTGASGSPGGGGVPGAGGDAASGGAGAGGVPPSSGGTVGSGGAQGSGGAGGANGSGGSTGTGGAKGSGGSTGSGGKGAGGMTGSGGSGQTTTDPQIPALTATCPTWANGDITFMGLSAIRIAVGAKTGSKAPMLVYWHGTGSHSNEYASMAAPVANGITNAGGVIVSFEGTTGGDVYSGTQIFGVGDLTLVDQLVACAVRDYNVDPRKIYTMGCSAGGLFATAMAAMRSSYVAAVAPNSGGQVVSLMFQNGHTPPLMTVHGAMGSDLVIVDFAQTSATADAAFKARGGFVIDCDTGGGHCSGSSLAGDAWTFLQAHPFGVSPEPWTALPGGFSNLCSIK